LYGKQTAVQITVHSKINYVCRVLFDYFKLFIIYKVDIENVAPDFGLEH